MSTVVFIIVLVVSWGIGVFAWAQIIGSVQNFSHRPAMRILTIIIWGGILAGSYFLVKAIAGDKETAWIIGMAVSFICVLSAGKIK